MNSLQNKNEKLINFRPLCLLAVSFLLGIFCSYKMAILEYLHFAVALLIALFAIVFACIKISNKKPFAVFFVICCVLFLVVGAGVTDIKIAKAKTSVFNNESGTFCGEIVNAQRREDGSYKVIFENCSLDGYDMLGNCVCYIFIDEINDGIFGYDLSEGLKYSFKAKVKNRYFEGERNVEIFNGVYYSLTLESDLTYVGSDLNLFQTIKSYVKKVFLNGMSYSSYSLALALITGDTSEIAVESLNNYRMAGIAHVFAVSGLHIGTLAMVLSFIFTRLKIKRTYAFFATVIPVTIYCGMCGFSESSLRALIMSGLLLLANCVGFKRDSLSAIAVASIIITAINPFALFDAGFQLSFTAVTSLVILAPLFLRGAKVNKTLGEPLALATSAQLGTLPVLTEMTGYISVISLLANLIFVPIVMLAFQFLLCSTIFASLEFAIFSSSEISLFLSDKLLYAINWTVNIFNFKNANITANFGSLSIIYYIGLVIASDVLNLKPKNKAILVALCILLSVILACV